MTPDLQVSFWARVTIPAEPDACWLWIGPRRSGGYAGFNVEAIRKRLASWPIWASGVFMLCGLLYLAATSVRG